MIEGGEVWQLKNRDEAATSRLEVWWTCTFYALLPLEFVCICLCCPCKVLNKKYNCGIPQ